MPKRACCYQTLVADYSKPGRVPDDQRHRLVAANDGYLQRIEATVPTMNAEYTKACIEAENRA